MSASTQTPRERYRQQVREEVKEKAWQQIAGSGASALSLNAIAKQMGMSGPALYRYFANRDELITELIRDAYRSLADAFTGVLGSTEGAGGGPDLAALARALRRWALEHPHRYFLVYGTPVPGYHAPQDITTIASEMMSVLLDACAAAGPQPDPAPPARAFEDHLAAGHREWAGDHPDAPPSNLRLALAFWTRLHGALSLELAGHFTGMGLDPDLLFESELGSLTAG
ncbi:MULTISPECIES: TetR/AcrR family transcriptional regulator [unclassified Streptomyces]|uniref:TetR/AcrR family transcriptional regulator n=1 Tax=unclassified Streptomyces TaxID=2593676 RepID=UPI002E370F9D|nr:MULTISPECIES: TetR/AcrR family transcriptional regulator [unclassified Streptomyces]WUC68029.1 TetR/AcrR family transcriptional regulator [Streptomyces sp. NBC_00539]